MNTDEFARMLRNRRSASRNALLVGFNGSAALFGHAPIEALLRDLFVRNRDLPPGREISVFGPSQILTHWGNLTNSEKLELLSKHTQPDRPDVDAIDALIELRREGYIHLLLMSDPIGNGGTLLNRSEPAWERYHCSRERTDVLTGFEPDKRAILVNASDVVLAAFVPGIHGVTGTLRREVHTSIREVLKKFDHILCWGWSDYNIRLSDLVGTERHSLYLLSAASDCKSTIIDGNPAEIVDDGLDPYGPDAGSITTDILKEIKRKLLPGPRRAANGAPAMTSPPADASASALRPHDADLCLLWDEASRAEILEHAKQNRISLIGVDGELVRSRVAFATSAALVRDGARCFWRPGADLLALDRLVATRCSAMYKQRAYMVVELLPIRVGDFITQYLKGWQSKLDTARHLHLIAFADLDALEPVTRVPSLSAVQPKLLLADACLTIQKLTRWVHRVYESSLRSCYDIDPADCSEFAIHARGTLPKTLDGADLDWAHDAFGQWLSEVAALGAESERKLTLEAWKDTWSRIAENYAIAYHRRRTRVDFDYADVGDPDPAAAPEPATATAIEDFEIGPIKKRTRGRQP
jgi:hypothetical protein